METVPPAAGHGALNAAIAAIVVVAIVVVGLGFANVIPGFHLSSGGSSSPPASTPTTYGVVFTEVGLAVGTSWSVTLAGSTATSTNGTVGFFEPSGSYPYSVGPVSGYRVQPSTGTAVVNGAATFIGLTFTSGVAGQYAVTFTETGLPSATPWNVTFNGSTEGATSGSITFSAPNGTYTYSVAAVSGYTAAPGSGSVSVSGANTNVDVTFTAVAVAHYSVTFNESGLPASTSWSVVLGGDTLSSTTASLTTAEPNGSYSYTVGAVAGYLATPSGGTVTVAGAPVYVDLVFSHGPPPTSNASYPVTIDQSGLPDNASWGVQFVLGAAIFSQSSEGSSQVVDLPNGTYNWSVSSNYLNASLSPQTQWLATPGFGNVTIAGSAQSWSTAFIPVAPTATNYSVTITETGLPSGEWWVLVGSSNDSASAGSPIVLMLPNGTVFFTTGTNVTGYSSYGFGAFDVEGAPTSTVVGFFQATTIVFNVTGAPIPAWLVELYQGGQVEDASGGGYFGNLTFVEPDGAYSWSALAVNAVLSQTNGTFTADGTPILIVLTARALPTYAVTLEITGLPSGYAWVGSIWVRGNVFGSSVGLEGFVGGSSAPFDLSNGTYEWSITALGANYVVTPASGVVVVHGAAVTVSGSYTPLGSQDLLVEFAESELTFGPFDGVPAGTSWNVTFDGITESTTGQVLYFLVPNGTYDYQVAAPAGYVAYPRGGTVTVNADPALSGLTTVVAVNVVMLPDPATPLSFAGGAVAHPFDPGWLVARRP